MATASANNDLRPFIKMGLLQISALAPQVAILQW
jgi:hypothetical protein